MSDLEWQESKMKEKMIKESKQPPICLEQLAADYKEDKKKGDIYSTKL